MVIKIDIFYWIGDKLRVRYEWSSDINNSLLNELFKIPFYD